MVQRLNEQRYGLNGLSITDEQFGSRDLFNYRVLTQPLRGFLGLTGIT